MSEVEATEYCELSSQAISLLQGKWRVQILCAMRTRSVRLGQLGRLIPTASKKALVANLRDLEMNGIVVRRDLSSKVRHVEYGFSDIMRPVIASVLDHLADVGEFCAALADKNKSPIQNVPARRNKVGRDG